MSLPPIIAQYLILNGVQPTDEQSKGQRPRLSSVEEDVYDLGLTIHEQTSAPRQVASWPGNCDTNACGTTGTYGDSCRGTCATCDRC